MSWEQKIAAIRLLPRALPDTALRLRAPLPEEQRASPNSIPYEYVRFLEHTNGGRFGGFVLFGKEDLAYVRGLLEQLEPAGNLFAFGVEDVGIVLAIATDASVQAVERGNQRMLASSFAEFLDQVALGPGYEVYYADASQHYLNSQGWLPFLKQQGWA